MSPQFLIEVELGWPVELVSDFLCSHGPYATCLHGGSGSGGSGSGGSGSGASGSGGLIHPSIPSRAHSATYCRMSTRHRSNGVSHTARHCVLVRVDCRSGLRSLGERIAGAHSARAGFGGSQHAVYDSIKAHQLNGLHGQIRKACRCEFSCCHQRVPDVLLVALRLRRVAFQKDPSVHAMQCAFKSLLHPVINEVKCSHIQHVCGAGARCGSRGSECRYRVGHHRKASASESER